MFLLIHEIFMMIMILAMMPMITLVWAKRRMMILATMLMIYGLGEEEENEEELADVG